MAAPPATEAKAAVGGTPRSSPGGKPPDGARAEQGEKDCRARPRTDRVRSTSQTSTNRKTERQQESSTGGAGRTGNGLTRRNRPSNVSRVAPEGIERDPEVRVRSLRTQQRAESQCQLYPVRGCWPALRAESSSRDGNSFGTTSYQACRDQRSPTGQCSVALCRHTGPAHAGRESYKHSRRV
jgi:hypothetical protein